ncbi:MAG: GtrA family protein [Oscillospiraceae bacterium]|nr:GtrA family protein [Oscillospiraceae bacterium]
MSDRTEPARGCCAQTDNDRPASAADARAVFLKFVASCVLSTAVDLGLFALLVALLRERGGPWYIPAATAAARVVSCACAYLLNHKLVFKSGRDMRGTAARYVALSVAQLAASAAGVTLLQRALGASELLVKIGVDSLLFFVSYAVQKKYVF